MFALPGRSYRGPFAPLTPDEIEVRGRLMGHIDTLAGTIGERNIYRPRSLARAAEYIEETFARFGYSPGSQEYSVSARRVRNIEAQRGGFANEILVIGAHYDSVIECPGANDNATGVAAVLELARLLAQSRLRRDLRLVAFVNEEPPFFMTEQMGSVVYARRCRMRQERIYGMFSLETIGYYSEEPDSQKYPMSPLLHLLYPDTANFLAFVANVASRRLLRDAGREFRKATKFPSEGAALPSDIPGVGWSDHWAFWQEGYPAVMVTDTAPYRYPHYHQQTDTPDKVNYDALARIVCGLKQMLEGLAGTWSSTSDRSSVHGP